MIARASLFLVVSEAAAILVVVAGWERAVCGLVELEEAVGEFYNVEKFYVPVFY
jgi:hypothetical protein